MGIAKYRKKPVVIEARQLTNTNVSKIADWCRGRIPDTNPRGVIVPTLEGVMFADRGDFIIRGVKGEFYPCKPDIFEATYERVEDRDGG